MLRILAAASLAATLFATNLLAAEAVPAAPQAVGPLAPGQAAGVHKAAITATGVAWVATIGVLGGLLGASVGQSGGVHLPTATLPTPAAVST